MTAGLLRAALIAVFLSGCAGQPLVPYSRSYEPLVLADGQNGSLRDGRARFREIFCAINRDHGQDLPDYRPCEESLSLIGEEDPLPGKPVGMEVSDAEMLVLLVPGLGFDCIRNWLLKDDVGAVSHVRQFGYEVRALEVSGLSSSQRNAGQIQTALMALPPEDASRPLVLIGYSKGATDVLEAMIQFPELAERVTAVVSYAGVVGGSALAEEVSPGLVNLLTWVPGSECEDPDGQALQSLYPSVRKSRLENHPLPASVRYYSVVSFPSPERISGGLKFSYRKLGRLVDARNDSQIVFYDQVIPGGTVMAFVDADHWAMAVPLARHRSLSAATVAGQNAFPREVMLEAILRYLEEDLAF